MRNARVLFCFVLPALLLVACQEPIDDGPTTVLDGTLFWAEGGSIGWVDVYSDSSVSGKSAYEDPPGDFLGFDVDAVHGKLYWIGTDGTVYRSGLDGSNEEAIYTPSGIPKSPPRSIRVDPAAGKVYWVDPGLQVIRQANLDGTDLTAWLGGLPDVSVIALDTGPSPALFWYNYVDETIRSVPMSDPSSVGVVVSSVAVSTFQVTSDGLYWTDRDTGTVQRADRDGQGREVVFSNIDSLDALCVDEAGGYIYWAELGIGVGPNSGLYRATLDGKNPEYLTSSALNPADFLCFVPAE